MEKAVLATIFWFLSDSGVEHEAKWLWKHDLLNADKNMEDNKRQHRRFRFVVDLILTIGGKELRCMGFDLSQGGIGFISSQKIELVERAKIQHATQEKFSREGSIIYSRPDLDNPRLFKNGFLFKKELTIQELHTWLQLSQYLPHS